MSNIQKLEMIATPNVIETVCTGNISRSEFTRLLTMKFLKDVGLQDIYKVLSSGTHVDIIKERKYENSEMNQKLVNLALNRNELNDDSQKMEDVYDASQKREIKNILSDVFKKDFDANIAIYAGMAVKKFAEEELQFRSEAVKYFGIGTESDFKNDGKKFYSDQTIAWTDRKAVFTMESKQHKFVQKLYSDAGIVLSEMKPVIAVLPAYAHGNPNLTYKDGFGNGKNHYFSMIERMIQDVPMAMNKLLGSDIKKKELQDKYRNNDLVM